MRPDRNVEASWLVRAGTCWICLVSLLAAESLEGQEYGSRASLLAPAPDEQPASPWSKPFPVSIPTAQPRRHEETQFDAWGESRSMNRVPEVASASRSRTESVVHGTLASRLREDVATPSISSSRREVQPTDPSPGWRSIESNVLAGLDRCDDHLRRGAVHSARQEVVASLKQLCRALDLHKQRWESEIACQQGLTALKEAEDFERVSITEPTSVQRLVQSHQTPILREVDLRSISPAIAAQHYRSYARNALIIASDEHPWAADLYLALGRTYEKEAMQDVARRMTLLQHATICFQSACAVDPSAYRLGFGVSLR